MNHVQVAGHTSDEQPCDSCSGRKCLLRIRTGEEDTRRCLQCFGQLVFEFGATGLKELKYKNWRRRLWARVAERRKFLEESKEFEVREE